MELNQQYEILQSLKEYLGYGQINVWSSWCELKIEDINMPPLIEVRNQHITIWTVLDYGGSVDFELANPKCFEKVKNFMEEHKRNSESGETR